MASEVRLSSELVNALRLAWDSIVAHKLRSFLTLLGVIIGVASVIMVGSAIDGLGLYARGEHRQSLRQRNRSWSRRWPRSAT